MEWTIDDTFTVVFDPPEGSEADPLPLPAVNDRDWAKGRYLLERWFVETEPAFAGLRVPANPGNDPPLLSHTEFSDSIVESDDAWYLWNGETRFVRPAIRRTGASQSLAATWS